MGIVQYVGAQNPHSEEVTVAGYQNFIIDCVPGEILTLPDAVCNYLVGIEPNWWSPANGWTPPAAGPQTGYVAWVYSGYTLTSQNGIVIADPTSGGSFAVTLPDATTVPGLKVTLKHPGSANTVTVTPAAGQTIDGAASFPLRAGEAVTVYSDATAKWRVLSSGAVASTPSSVEIASQGTVHAKDYGAKGDGIFLYSAVMTAGSAVLNSTDTGVNFTNADIGKTIIVSGVAAGNDSLVTTIFSVQSASQCTLSATATVNSPDAAGSQIAVYGTDDTAAIQAASDAAAGGSGTLEFDSKTYIIAGPLVQGGTRRTNSQLTLPNYASNPFLGNIGRLVWKGARDFSGACGNQPFPGPGGTVLVSTLVGQTYSGTYGIPSVVGGPTQEQSANWSFWMFVAEDLCVLTPRNPSLSAFNLERTSAQNRRRVTAGTLEYGFSSSTGDAVSATKPSHPWAAGFIDPLGANFQGGSGRSEQICTWGYVVGIAPAEHSNVTQLQVFGTYIPIAIRNGYRHAAKFNYIISQTNPYLVSGWDPTQSTVAAAILPVPAPLGTGGNLLLLDEVDLEDYSDTNQGNFAWTVLVTHINDANNHLNGYVRFSRWTWSSGSFIGSTSLVVTGGSGVAVQPVNTGSPVSMLGQATLDALMPWLLTINPLLDQADAEVTQGTWTLTVDGTAVMGGYTYNSSLVQNDEIAYELPLAAGTWKFALMFRKAPTAAIYTVKLDGVSVGTIDSYAASGSNNNLATIAGIAVAASGKHKLSLAAATRNASATSWLLGHQLIQLRRTA